MVKNRMTEKEVLEITSSLINKYNLNMRVVGSSYEDDNKIVITYVCEDRVDFRELVKQLAGILKLRIELKQIGVRDHAKKVGGIGICGKECCCKLYLNDFDKVSVKMAKVQGLSLNPTKISGVCGRLMCCLAYENNFYQDITSKFPKLYSEVETADGVGTVIYLDILKEKISVKIANDSDIKVIEYELSDIIREIKKDNTLPNKTNKDFQGNFKNKNINKSSPNNLNTANSPSQNVNSGKNLNTNNKQNNNLNTANSPSQNVNSVKSPNTNNKQNNNLNLANSPSQNINSGKSPNTNNKQNNNLNRKNIKTNKVEDNNKNA